MKKVFALLAFAVLAMGAHAQDISNTTISIGINAGIPISSPAMYSLVLGADVEADFAVASTMKITGSVGYQNFGIKNKYGGGNTYRIPLLAGAKFNIGENAYGHAQLGAGFAEGTTSFAYAPSLGYYFSPHLDASVRYLAYNHKNYTMGSFGIRLAYSF